MNLDAYFRIKEEIGNSVKLVAVSKKQDIEKIKLLIDNGQYYFGENYVQELVKRYESIQHSEVEWHMIGHLQSNKVKSIAPFISYIQSIDSFNLLKMVNKEASKHNRIISVLLQIYIATEESKFGMNKLECINLLENNELSSFLNIRIMGLMGMASFTDDHTIVRKEFKALKQLFDYLKSNYFNNNKDFYTLSMGMSDDYKIAIDEGSNLIRIGTLIFGKRVY